MTPNASFWPSLYLPLLCINYWAEREREREREIERKSDNNKRERSDNKASGEKKIAHKMHRQLMLEKI
jgi:hypothetical protein